MVEAMKAFLKMDYPSFPVLVISPPMIDVKRIMSSGERACIPGGVSKVFSSYELFRFVPSYRYYNTFI
jgi:hypothetical protein